MKDITGFDWCYKTSTKEKGYILYKKTSFKEIKKEKNKYVTFIDDFEVTLEFGDAQKEILDDDYCTCDKYELEGECEHIYAFICEVKKVSKNLPIANKEKNKSKKRNVGSILKTIGQILLIPSKILLGILGLSSIINKSNSSKKSDLDMYNLSKEEQDLVKSGKYDPENFEEDDSSDDDDYYHDDVD